MYRIWCFVQTLQQYETLCVKVYERSTRNSQESSFSQDLVSVVEICVCLIEVCITFILLYIHAYTGFKKGGGQIF